MKNLWFIFFYILSFTSFTIAQQIAPLPAALVVLQPVNVFPADPQNGYEFFDKSGAAKPATFSVAIQDDAPVFTAEIFTIAQSHFNIQSLWKNTGLIEKGEVLLARTSVRAMYARQESGDAVLNFFVQQAIAPFDRAVLIEMRVGPEWKTFDIPFTATQDIKPGDGSIGFTYGALSQKVEIAGIQVLNFGKKATVAQMPATRFTYTGREAGAAWRNEALKRITELRTAPLIIQVKDRKGNPVKGAIVTAQLVNPEFAFGTAASADLICGEDSNAVIYKRQLTELFNSITLDNNLKWPEWRNPEKRKKTKTAIVWILNNNLRLRGHNLVWPGRKFSPSVFGKQPDFGLHFTDSINAHIQDIATYTKGKVYAWDVINEMVHEKDYFQVMPRLQAVEWFKLAKQTDPNATLYINEYGMLNNIASQKNIKEYLVLIDELRKGGAPIEAIGVQGHVGRQPRSPKEVLTDLDLFTETGLPVQITEFDINSPDEALQADYTRDFLIAIYSHPVVTGFTMWGFWEPAHWKPDAAMYKKDWTAKPNAAAWKNLVLKEWRTRISQPTSASGAVNSRGHLGKYEITITKDGKSFKSVYQLTKNGKPAEMEL